MTILEICLICSNLLFLILVFNKPQKSLVDIDRYNELVGYVESFEKIKGEMEGSINRKKEEIVDLTFKIKSMRSDMENTKIAIGYFERIVKEHHVESYFAVNLYVEIIKHKIQLAEQALREIKQ